MSHNGFIGNICCPQNQAEYMTRAIAVLQSVTWRECSVCKYIKKGSGHGGRGRRWLINYSQQGSGQTISGIQLLWTSHVSGMPQPWPTSPLCETIYGPRNGKRTCIKQGCAPGVSVWMGSMGAENLLMQKASYETREGKQRGEALLDAWRE